VEAVIFVDGVEEHVEDCGADLSISGGMQGQRSSDLMG
jgi:hypothetical protein